MITTQWFMCLFIGAVPFEFSLRILDIFLYEGRDFLQRFGLNLLRMLKPVILAQNDPVMLIQQIKDFSMENESRLYEVKFCLFF